MWHFQPIFDSYGFIALLAVVLILSTWARPTYGTLTTRRRRVLIAVRAVVLLTLLLAMLRPTHIERTERTQPATLVVMLDQTRSMTVADIQGQSRWQVLRDTIQGVRSELAEAAEKFDVRLYGFDEQAAQLTAKQGMPTLPEVPTGEQSDIGSSLYDVLRLESGKRLAGIILMSDGAQRVVAPRVDLQQPAREMARMRFPLYTITMGMPRDPAQTRDAAIQELNDHYTLFVKNQLPIRGAIWLQGLSNRAIPVSMEVSRPDGKVDSVGPVTVTATQPAEAVPFALDYTPDIPGEYRLTVNVPVQPGELVADNNQLTTYLTVLDGGVRVLYLDGNVASQEPKFVQRSLGESPEIELDYELVLASNLSKWPLTLPQLDAKPPYDVVLIGDLDSDALGTANGQRLAELTSAGTGLMMLGGLHSFGPGGYGTNPLSDVMPVTMSALERQTFAGPVRTDQHWEGEIRLVPKFPHFVTQLAADKDNSQAWSNLPPLIGANRLQKLNERAIVLLAGENDQPMLVASQHGKGRVLLFAGDSTSRWYRYGHTAEHKRFWRQLILWLSQKENLSQSDVWIRMDRRRYLAGGRAEFALGARNDAGDPIDDVSFEITMTGPTGQETKLTATREKETWRGITSVLTTGGQYTIQAVARRQATELKRVRTEFVVRAEDLELSDPAASPEQLKQLAKLTEAAGGRSLAPEQLRELLRTLIDKPVEVKVEFESKWQLGDTLPDAWALFALFVAVLSCDWMLRKRWRMV